MRFPKWKWIAGSVALVVTAAALAFLPDGEAEATSVSAKTGKLLRILESDQAACLKLCAIDALRKSSETGIDDELVKLAKRSDVGLGVAATTALGKRKTSAAKTELKALLESGVVAKNVRIGAMTAIAVHWKDASDIPYLESKTASDSVLKAHSAWLKTNLYERVRGGDR